MLSRDGAVKGTRISWDHVCMGEGEEGKWNLSRDFSHFLQLFRPPRNTVSHIYYDNLYSLEEGLTTVKQWKDSGDHRRVAPRGNRGSGSSTETRVQTWSSLTKHRGHPVKC